MVGLSCFLIGSMTASCAPYTKEYEFISFEESPGSIVVEASREPSRRVKSVTPIPVEYKFDRKNYILRVRLDQNYALKRISIGAYNIQGESLVLKGKEVRGPVDSSIKKDFGYRYDYFYDWSPGKKKTLEFTVMNRKGELVGKEQIPFKIRSSGIIVEWDGL